MVADLEVVLFKRMNETVVLTAFSSDTFSSLRTRLVLGLAIFNGEND